MKKLYQILKKKLIEDITSKIHEYCKTLKVGTNNINNFTNINEIEKNLYEIIDCNRNIYLDATSNFLSSIDEKELIEQKKNEFAKLGIHLINHGRYYKKILTRCGYIKYKRTILIPKDRESRSKLRDILKYKKKSIAPLDIILGIEILSFKITCNMMLFIAKIAISQGSYEQAQQIIYDTTSIELSDDTIRKVVNYIGKLVYEQDCQTARDLIAQYSTLRNIHSNDKQDAIFYIECDGNFVNTRTKNDANSTWRENKLGVVFNSTDIERKKNKKGEEYSIIKKCEYISFFCKSNDFNRYLFALALKNNVYNFKTIIILSDGASWIKTFKKEYFPEAIHILDFYHLAENVGNFAKFIYKDNPEQASIAADRWCKDLKESKYNDVLDELKDYETIKLPTGIVNLCTYIRNNIDLIDYKEYIKKGYYIGSGVIEGANKNIIKSRMKLSGMRWDTINAQFVATLRAKYCSKIWDEVKTILYKKLCVKL